MIVTGVAVAVAFFVLFASMSAGLNRFIDDELERPRTTHIYLESGSPTPFSSDQLGLIELVASRSEADTGVPHYVTPRSVHTIRTSTERPVRLWGVMVLQDGDMVSPPYDTSTDLAWGRHLSSEDASNLSDPIPVVLGHSANEALNPNSGTLMFITLRPDRDVTPWWMPDANDYPLEARDAVTSSPRGPVEGRVVGVMSPDQGEDLDWGVFASVEPLLGLLGQHDESRGKTYYPQVVVTIDDGSRVDVRDLEETLVETVPGIQGTDDHWDPEEFKATYGGAVGALDGWLVIITVVLVIMLVAGVSDTTLVAVTDRKREIATLRAVGIGRRQVSRLVLTEVLLLVGTGLLVGLVIGSSLALLFGYLHDTTGGSGAFLAPTELSPLVLVGAATLALSAAVMAAAYPALRAAGQRPTEALRYE